MACSMAFSPAAFSTSRRAYTAGTPGFSPGLVDPQRDARSQTQGSGLSPLKLARRPESQTLRTDD